MLNTRPGRRAADTHFCGALDVARQTRVYDRGKKKKKTQWSFFNNIEMTSVSFLLLFPHLLQGNTTIFKSQYDVLYNKLRAASVGLESPRLARPTLSLRLADDEEEEEKKGPSCAARWNNVDIHFGYEQSRSTTSIYLSFHRMQMTF